MRPRAFAIPVALSGIIAASCSVTPATQFTVGVTSQIIVPADVASVRITASTGGNRGFCQTYPVVNGTARLPQSLALAPDQASDPTLQVTVNVMGFSVSDQRVKNEQTFDDCTIPIVSPSDSATEDPSSSPPNARILRRSKQAYTAAHNLFLPMPLKYACYGVNCPGDQVCKGGQCVDSLSNIKLPDYDDALLFGASSSCFNASVCLGDAVGPNIIDAKNCVYEVPSGSSLATAGMNVRAIYEPYRVEILDLDPPNISDGEGFSIPDPSKPSQFKLASSLCSGGLGPKIKNLVASTTCAAKNQFQPLCTADATTAALAPTPSLVYLVVDQDQSMLDYVGTNTNGSLDKSGALNAALALALGDPVFLTTEIALRFVPDVGTECTSSKYGTPDTLVITPFRAIDAALSPLVLGIGNAPLFTTSGLALNALLSATGVYALAPPSSSAFNHKVIALVTNRSLDPTLPANCSPNGAAAAVKAAQAAGYDTYLFSLRNAFESAQTTQVRIAAAQAFATASGAQLVSAEGGAAGDASMSKVAAAEGLAQMIGNLGGCLYDKPSNLVDATTATLTLKPAGPFAPVKLPLDPTCATNASAASGWAIDQDKGHIRVCGAACTSIQTAIQENALITAQRDATGPTQVMPGQVLVMLTVP